MTTVVVGCNSMIARVLRQSPATRNWLYLSHTQALAHPQRLQLATCIFNFAFDPRLRSSVYDEMLDFDLRLGHLLEDRPVTYVMASTRLVYGPARGDFRLAEDMEPQPNTHYGASKLECESRLGSILGNRLIVLRLSNVFDSSEVDGERQSFFGLALRKLKHEGRIVLDISPFVERDFMPATVIAKQLFIIAKRPVPGVFNLGAGFGAPTGRICQWLIEGRGSGELVIENFRDVDQFSLDTSKAALTWGFAPFSAAMLQSHCVAVGATLRSV